MMYYLRAVQADAWIDLGTLHSKSLFRDPASKQASKQAYEIDIRQVRNINHGLISSIHRRTYHDLPDLYRTDPWVGTYLVQKYACPTDHHVETCTDHTDRTRSEYDVRKNPDTRPL